MAVKTCQKAWAPPPRQTVSEWADAERRLSPESASEAGKYYTSRTEYARGIMDAFSDPAVQRVVVMSSAQVAKSTILENVAGYYAHRDQCPIMIVQPTLTMAEDFSKKRIAPMIRDTPALTGLFTKANARNSGNTTLDKQFRGGYLVLAGANSPASLAGRPIRVALGDEVDRWQDNVGSEGDPVELLSVRTTAWWNRKLGFFSTPTVEGNSAIAGLYEESDQSKFFVPCHHCKHEFVLQFEHLKYTEGEAILANEDGKLIRTAVDAWFECPECNGRLNDAQRMSMVRAGRWQATKPFHGTRGFWLWAAYSPFVTAMEIANKWLRALGDHEKMISFRNLVLGLTHRETGEAPDSEKLYGRRESHSLGTVQPGVLFLTAGADVQKDRIEVSIYGWGRNRQCWLVDHVILSGRTSEEQIWSELTEIRLRSYRHPGGAMLNIARFCVDSGFESQMVYRWVREQHTPDVMAVDGRTSLGGMTVGQPSPVDVDIAGRKIKRGIRVWPVDTGKLKSELYGRLNLPKPEDGEPYPNGYLHLPQVSEEFCRQLTAEHLVTKLNNKGYRIHQWEKMRDRNEAMDCHVYSRAGAHQLGVDRFSEREWRRIEAIVLPAGEIPVPAPSPEVEPIPQVPAAIYSQEPAPPPPAYQVQAPRPKAKMPRVFRSNWLGR